MELPPPSHAHTILNTYCPGMFKKNNECKFWRIWQEECVRDEPFLGDKSICDDLYKHNVCLYNPSEGSVPLEMVNDVILDFDFFPNVNDDNELERFKSALIEELNKRSEAKEEI